ncbi:MAG: hypothetical protein ACRCYR_03670 [Phycicoccus sp.]
MSTVPPSVPIGFDLPDALLKIALAEAAAGEIDARAKALRAEVKQHIAAQYDDTGVKCAVDVRIPGTKQTVGKVSTTVTHDKAVVADSDALLDWVVEQHPTEVDYTPTIRPAFLSRLLKGIVFEPDPDHPEQLTSIDKTTGEAVPGLRLQAGGSVLSFAIKERDTAGLLAHLDTLGLAGFIQAADGALESAATTVTGEIADGEVAA